MRRALVLVLALAALESASLKAADGGLSLGLVAGNPAGLSAAYDFAFPAGGSRSLAWTAGVQGSAGWDLVSPGGFAATADALIRFGKLLRLGSVAVPLYAGVGGKFTALVGAGRYGKSEADFGLSIRLPLGLRWDFGGPPLEAFLEVVPGLLVHPVARWDAGVGLGLRWRF